MEEKKTITPDEFFRKIRPELEAGKAVLFTVSGSSMLPAVADGRDLAKAELCDLQKLRRLDVVVVRTDSGRYIMHRIIKLTEFGFCTCGDWCEKDDGFFRFDQVVAQITEFRRRGKAINLESVFWRAVFALWVAAAPVRPAMKRLCGAVSKII